MKQTLIERNAHALRIVLTAALLAWLGIGWALADPVELAFDTEVLHSKRWLDLANCGDYPGLASSPEHVHMAWHGTLSFEAPATPGWFTTDSFAFWSDRTEPGDFKAYVSGFYAPGGYVTLFVDFSDISEYADAVLQLPLAAPVPEPLPLMVLGLGLLAIAVRRFA